LELKILRSLIKKTGEGFLYFGTEGSVEIHLATKFFPALAQREAGDLADLR
jgi:hypothetical protein